jgi:hypothetical protein
MTLSFEETDTLLHEMADSLPAEIFRELNGGVVLLPDTKIHPESNEAGTLYILGEYRADRPGYGLGRYIVVFYGSFIRTFSGLPFNRQVSELKKVLHHELTHHLESLAGERGLEITDAITLERFKAL